MKKMKKLYVACKYTDEDGEEGHNSFVITFPKIKSEDDMDLIEELVTRMGGHETVCIINFRRLE